MLEFEIIARGLYSQEQVIVDYRPELRMVAPPETQQWMELQWQSSLAQAKERGTLLFDASLFRFVEAAPDGDGTLRLVVGDTSYKEYVTTRIATFAAGRTREELGDPLAVCSVIETSDNYILLDKRQGVDVYVGRYHVIGGFFERERDTVQGGATPDPFAAVRREILEETGVLGTDISEQYCLGVVYDVQTPHAELCFLTRLHIPLDEIKQHRTPLDHEIRQLRELKVSEQSLSEFIINNHGNISATGEPNLLFYGAWKFGETWFERIINTIVTFE
jgi:8-oxo-dGTP pyrophosphatase MutT (NUDIX family)